MPRSKLPIKAQIITGTDRYRLIFIEHPDWVFNTEFTDPKIAKDYGKRCKAELFALREAKQEETKLFKVLGKDFFDPKGPWAADQKEAGAKRIKHTIDTYSQILENHLIPALGDMDVREILGKHIKKALSEARHVKTGKPLARATKARGQWVLSLMFNYWITEGIVTNNPVAAMTKYDGSAEKPRDALPRDVRAALFPNSYAESLAIWRSPMWTAYFGILDDTGARNGEPRSLRWRDIDWEHHFIPLITAIEACTVDTVKETKNGKKKPGWPSEVTVEALRAWQTASKFKKPDDWIFTSNGKAPISNNAVLKAFKATMKEQGYSGLGWTPYWLRHSFVTYESEHLTPEQVNMLAGDSEHIKDYKHFDVEGLRIQGMEAKERLDKARNEENTPKA